MTDQEKIKLLRSALEPFADYERIHVDAWRGDEEGVVIGLNNDPDHDEVYATRVFRVARDAMIQTR